MVDYTKMFEIIQHEIDFENMCISNYEKWEDCSEKQDGLQICWATKLAAQNLFFKLQNEFPEVMLEYLQNQKQIKS